MHRFYNVIKHLKKILFIWSRFGNLSRSIDDDDDDEEDEDDNEVAQNGTLKANNVMEEVNHIHGIL